MYRSKTGRALWTWRDLPMISPPESFGHELYEGVMYVQEGPGEVHQQVSGEVFAILRERVMRAGLGRVFHAPFDVVLAETTVVQPDVLAVANDRARFLHSGKRVMGAPDLVVEVLSAETARRDRSSKTALYLRHGVREVWLVEPDRRWVEVVRLPAEDPSRVRHAPGDSIVSAAFPIIVDVADVFADPFGQTRMPPP